MTVYHLVAIGIWLIPVWVFLSCIIDVLKNNPDEPEHNAYYYSMGFFLSFIVIAACLRAGYVIWIVK